MDYGRRDTDVLIIGAGAAGLRTAIELSAQGVEPLLVSKRVHGDAHTRMAAGGINASLGSRDPEDDWTLHAADTLREGHFVCQPRAVELLARRAPERLMELAEWGCPFERTESGDIDQRYFGAQSYRRTCFVGDRTGEAIMETLVEQARRLNVSHVDEICVTEILVHQDQAVGAIGWDMNTGEALVFSARAVVLAAGGCTGIYRRSSSRLGENTGDAMALAAAAGATLRDMEYVQFHPTGMIRPQEMKGTLVTEAVRGEGGRLYNSDGRRFMGDYAPDEMELAPRDVVARAIAHELEEGHGTEAGGVYLDISHRDRDFIEDRLPTVYERFSQLGIDISQEPMEVAPTAHYAMGGVKVDFQTGATDVEGLFAVGEATSGLHGANRLGGNSLAETVVFGQMTGEYLIGWIEDHDQPRFDYGFAEERLRGWRQQSQSSGQYQPDELIEELRDIVEGRAGIVRTQQELEQGLEELADLRDRSRNLRVYTQPGSEIFDQICNLRFMLDTAEMLLCSALERTESRGAHYRADYPDSEEAWKASILCRRADGDTLTLDKEPVEEPTKEVKKALEREVRLDYHHLE